MPTLNTSRTFVSVAGDVVEYQVASDFQLYEISIMNAMNAMNERDDRERRARALGRIVADQDGILVSPHSIPLDGMEANTLKNKQKEMINWLKESQLAGGTSDP